MNPVLEKEELHDGIDIMVPEGTEVKAVMSGVVTDAALSQTFGKYICVQSENGYRYKFAHLSEILVNVGDAVTQGQTVAISGNTGLSTGAHLHYSLWIDELLSDPISFVDYPFTEEVSQEYAARGEELAGNP